MIPIKYKNYLVAHGATKTPHSGDTLWDHLAGVHRLLAVTGSNDELCTAGLFHSVYGTARFKQSTIERAKRPEVQELIGTQAEEIVWIFCNLPRPQLFEISLKTQKFEWLDQMQTARCKSDLWDDLLRLECANLLEQKGLHPFTFLVRHAQAIGMLDREGFSI